MNNIRQIQALNKRELENGISPDASWHADYRDTAYVYIGGLPFDLSEGDIITIFSQFGEPVHLNLVRDKETGKSRGFAFLKYEDQRSTDLAVDNLGGATMMGRVLRVDHTRYKPKEGEVIEDNTYGDPDGSKREGNDHEDEDRRKRRRTDESDSDDDDRPMLPEERELLQLLGEHDDEDPMKEYLIKEKREAVEAAIEKYKKDKRPARKDKESRHHHHRHHYRRHRHRHRDRSEGYSDDDDYRRRHSRRHEDPDREPYDDGRRHHRHRRHQERSDGSSDDDRARRRRSRRESGSRSPRADDDDDRNGRRGHRRSSPGQPLDGRAGERYHRRDPRRRTMSRSPRRSLG